MSHIEFNSVFVESEAPDTKSFCKVESIDLLDINTAEDDTENTGDYYVWLYLRGGKIVAAFRGTLEACQERYEMIKADMIESERRQINGD